MHGEITGMSPEKLGRLGCVYFSTAVYNGAYGEHFNGVGVYRLRQYIGLLSLDDKWQLDSVSGTPFIDCNTSVLN